MRYFLILTILNFLAFSLEAQTKVVVRAKAKDAKFIGSSIGGAKVIIREVVTGKILDEGMTKGGTGDTDLIMRQPHKRYTDISDESAAHYTALLDIKDPTFVEIEVIAPINQKQAAITASTQLWVLPDKHILGDGVVLDIPGFIVDVLSPQTHEGLSAGEIRIIANVVMMCGCPITPDGLWDANEIDVGARISKDGEFIKSIMLTITEKANTFKGSFEGAAAGLYEIAVFAYDKRSGNTGLDKVNIIVRAE